MPAGARLQLHASSLLHMLATAAVAVVRHPLQPVNATGRTVLSVRRTPCNGVPAIMSTANRNESNGEYWDRVRYSSAVTVLFYCNCNRLLQLQYERESVESSSLLGLVERHCEAFPHRVVSLFFSSS